MQAVNPGYREPPREKFAYGSLLVEALEATRCVALRSTLFHG